MLEEVIIIKRGTSIEGFFIWKEENIEMAPASSRKLKNGKNEGTENKGGQKRELVKSSITAGANNRIGEG